MCATRHETHFRPNISSRPEPDRRRQKVGRKNAIFFCDRFPCRTCFISFFCFSFSFSLLLFKFLVVFLGKANMLVSPFFLIRPASAFSILTPPQPLHHHGARVWKKEAGDGNASHLQRALCSPKGGTQCERQSGKQYGWSSTLTPAHVRSDASPIFLTSSSFSSAAPSAFLILVLFLLPVLRLASFGSLRDPTDL